MVEVIVISKDEIEIEELEQKLVAKTQIELTAKFGDQIIVKNRRITTTEYVENVQREYRNDGESSLFLLIPTILLLLAIVCVIFIIYHHKRIQNEDDKGVGEKRVTQLVLGVT